MTSEKDGGKVNNKSGGHRVDEEPDDCSFAATNWERPKLPQTATEVRSLLRDDLMRYGGSRGLAAAIKHFVVTPGFKFSFWLRWTSYLKRSRGGRLTLYPLCKYLKLRCQYKYGITISEDSPIGGGLFINRFGGIYFHKDVAIGRNVNVTHGVVLGQVNGGSKKGSPTIGDRVFLGSGCKVVGRVHVGNDAAIGANALVASDVPAKGVMGAPQANLISQRGSGAYINHQA
jgi:serine O-acetyltransferase